MRLSCENLVKLFQRCNKTKRVKILRGVKIHRTNVTSPVRTAVSPVLNTISTTYT